jgi:probable F420-dependent oxidoreductase
MKLGKIGAWFGPQHDDAARVGYVVDAERFGYGTAWLGLGQASVSDLRLFEDILDATTHITVASAIVNVWTNDPGPIARSYRRINAKHPDRFLLGIGIGHPEAVRDYRSPYETIVSYLDELGVGGVPKQGRILAALGPRMLRLARDRAAGAHPYLVVPEHTGGRGRSSAANRSWPRSRKRSSATIRRPPERSAGPTSSPISDSATTSAT